MPVTPSRWFITGYAHRPEPPLFWIQIQTDEPCHLWCYWTAVKPLSHTEAYALRGLRAMLELRWCFVEYTGVEQEEAGDTISHTFYIPDWPICEWRYWAFAGTINDVRSPSASCIFKVHRAPVYTFNTSWLNPRRMDGGYIRYAGGEPHMLHYPAATIRAGQMYVVVSTYSWHRAFLRFHIPIEIAHGTTFRVILHLYYLNNYRRGTAPQRLNVRHLNPQNSWQWPFFPLTMSDWPLPGPIIYPFNLTKDDPVGQWVQADLTLPHVMNQWQTYPYMALKLQGHPEDEDMDNYIDYYFFGPATYERRLRPDGYYWYARPILQIDWYAPA